MKPPLPALILILALGLPALGQAPCPPGQSCPLPSAIPPSPLWNYGVGTAVSAPWETVLRVQAGDGTGTATVIDGSPESAHAITAAHVVAGHARVYVETFRLASPAGAVGVPMRFERGPNYVATVVASDPSLDVAIVRFAPHRELPASELAAEGWSPSPGQWLCSLGCSKGADPTGQVSRFLKVERHADGWTGLVTDKRPKPGRSGGGLFSLDGRLVGVCDFAAVEGPPEGMYAGPASIRSVLARLPTVALRSRQPPGPIVIVEPPLPRPAAPFPGIPESPPVAIPGVFTLLGALGLGIPALGGTVAGVWALARRKRPPESTSIPSPDVALTALIASIEARDRLEKAQADELARKARRAELLGKFRELVKPTEPVPNV